MTRLRDAIGTIIDLDETIVLWRNLMDANGERQMVIIWKGKARALPENYQNCSKCKMITSVMLSSDAVNIIIEEK